MTMVLRYLTSDFVIQVSDRRLVWPDGSLADDDANKATIYCGRVAIGYTGLAQIRTKRTDEWLAGSLSKAQSAPQAFEMLKSEATTHFRGLAHTPRQRRHAFVGAGWTKQTDSEPPRPFLARVSNYHDANSAELANAEPEFGYRVWIPSLEELPKLNTTGRHLSEDEARLLGAALSHLKDPTQIAEALCLAIRVAAGRDSGIGRGVLAVHIPQAAVENPTHQFMVIFGATAPEPFVPHATGSFYLPADSQTAVQHAPNVVCYGVAAVQVQGGPLPKDEP